jgi:hypothetical protein
LNLSAAEIQATWAEYYKSIEETNDLADAYYDHVEQANLEQHRSDQEIAAEYAAMTDSPPRQSSSPVRRNLFSSHTADTQTDTNNTAKGTNSATTPNSSITKELNDIVAKHFTAREQQFQDRQRQYLANQVERDRQFHADILRAVQEQQSERDRAHLEAQQQQDHDRQEQQERILQEYRSKTDQVVERLDNLEEFIRLCMSNSNQASTTHENAGASGTSN